MQFFSFYTPKLSLIIDFISINLMMIISSLLLISVFNTDQFLIASYFDLSIKKFKKTDLKKKHYLFPNL